jgi:putative oxidoreductase
MAVTAEAFACGIKPAAFRVLLTEMTLLMNFAFRYFFHPPSGPAAIFFIRLAVGVIFFTQGVLKFTDPAMGVNRFTRIGFPHPAFTSHFVGWFEIICGLLVLIGLWTRAASIPLLIIIVTAIVTTKLPELSRPVQGFWYMVSDARTDFAMLCSLLFLILSGGGTWALEQSRRSPR